MLNAYENHLLNTYLANIVRPLRHWSPMTPKLVEWLVDDWNDYNLIDGAPAKPEHDAEIAQRRQLQKRWEESEVRKSGRVKSVSPKTFELAREIVLGSLAPKPPKPPKLDPTARRLRELQEVAGLSNVEREVLELLLRYATCDAVDSLIDEVFDRSSTRQRMNVTGLALTMPLGLKPKNIATSLERQSPLVRSGLVEIDDDGDVSIPRWLHKLAGPETKSRDIRQLLLQTAMPSDLEWSDFDHVAKCRDHIADLLKGALRDRSKGVNILLYGPPGTGKTEFCKVLARQLETRLYTVGEADDDGMEPTRNERQQELIFAQRLLASDENSLLLFDEMEDLLGGGFDIAQLFGGMGMMSSGHRQGESKVFMHRLLEETPVPVLWTMNNARSVCPAILRRMMYALELRPPGANIRARVWARQLEKNQIAASTDEIRELAREFDATPAVAAGATAAARIGDGNLEKVRVGVRSLQKLLSGDKPRRKTPVEFDLGLIQADTDPKSLADRIASTAKRDFSLCLQGPPGTGKSAFVRYLAERLGLEVMQKRASDLMSPFVGATEMLIARAFAEARDAEAFLIFDEAESLLSDRRKASKSWEVSQVNEMLTWMESHPQPLACTTNFSDRLDEATLRRFTFKVTLDYLTAEQARFAFGKFFSLEPPTGLNLISALTPGDFAVVRKKAEVLGCLDEPDTLAAMLRAESDAKPNRPKSIGFLD
ncbi:MAG: AAA family ATPase [Gammaproteobacteria bacterium]|nr:AAA family ATPase [Gammaproteobacteria bacterium]MXY91135.1 AAA family ATPase [Gammaproteobacteria bacterium]MYE99369.1 AAA family ATPase [Gammaproteobacteria bacterium]MYG97510.1 AAA family ATPase [Gammaproteobacteria bacterium]